MQIRILRHECCGSGDCVMLCPAVFALDERSKCTVIDAEADVAEKLLEAAEACPSQAIQLLDDAGVEIFP